MLTEARQPDLPEWLHDLYPFHTRMADLGQYRMSLVDEGPSDAPPLLLLHGNPTWSFLFRDLIAQAREQFRVVAPDNIGFGLSDKPLDPAYHTLVRHIENLTALVETMRLRDITIVAQGWGGLIGLGYAIANPDNVARMVLCNTWALPLPNPLHIKLPWAVRLSESGRLGQFLDSVLTLSVASSISSRMHRKPSDWVIEAYNYPFPDKKARVAPQAFSAMFFDANSPARATMEGIYEGLKHVTAPVDLLYGQLDPILTKLPAYLLRDALPNSREPIFVEDASHLIPEDAPAVLADKVLNFGKKDTEVHEAETLFKIL